MRIGVSTEEPPSVAAAIYEVSQILYAGKQDVKIRIVTLPTGDVQIIYGDKHLLIELKTVLDILASRGKRFRDQKQRLSKITIPTILIIRGWWGDPTFKCDNCRKTNKYVLCPSCKRPNQYRRDNLKRSDQKSIGTMMVELMKLGIPAFSVPDDFIMAYVMFQYFELDLDEVTRYRIVADVNRKIQLNYRVCLQYEDVGEKGALAIANAVDNPSQLNDLTPESISHILRAAKGDPDKKTILKKAQSFYDQHHGIEH